MVLLQTLVMSVIMSLMAVMVLKWIMGRYMMAARGYRTTVSMGRADGFFQDRMASWNWTTSGMSYDSYRLVSEPVSQEKQCVHVYSQGAGQFLVTTDDSKLNATCP